MFATRMRQAAAAVTVEPTVTFLAYGTGDGTGSTSESVTLDLGTAKAGDKIVIIIGHALWAATNDNVSTMQFDGATSLTDTNIDASNASEHTEMWYYDDTAGTIGGSTSIDCTFATAQEINLIAAWRLSGYATGAPADSATTTSDGGSLNCDTTVNAAIIAGTQNRSGSNATLAWVGATEDFEDYVGGTHDIGGASAQAVSAETPRTINVTATGESSPNRYCSVAAVWATA